MSALALQDSKKEAWDRFQALPWPSKTDEEWRRTDPGVIPVSSKTGPETTSSAVSVGWETVPPEWIRAGVILTDLATALRQFPERVEEYLFRSGNPEGFPKFVALHQALWNQGLFGYIPDGVTVELPLKSWVEIPPGSTSVYPHLLLVVGHEAGQGDDDKDLGDL